MSDISNESTIVPQPSLNNPIITFKNQSYHLGISLYPNHQDSLKWEDNITKYFNSLKRIWQDLDLFNTYEWKFVEDGCHHKKTMEDNRIFKFLVGLNVEFDEVRGRIIGRQPMPSIREVFSEVRREESRRNVMLARRDLELLLKVQPWLPRVEAIIKPLCFCANQMKDHGFGRAIIPIANEDETSPFTTEQMEHLLALLKFNSTSGTPSVSVAHTGKDIFP
ncbi:hypothetical protein CK203_023551 [Vitis vinifera]|uniref:Uncharacterized protein n=1 Tax=Vitis vinifera TaxID=29760 RepID=A0A438JC04_VITVI|nr:hypothetical protein CK203_023551 [Vitis vinifera]